jgi:purine-binding chemotaxis protein CheW
MTRRRAGDAAGADGAADQAARPLPARPDEDRPTRGLLTLRLGDALFGLWVDDALEIVTTPPISRLPLPESEVAGVTGVRGEVVPVLDLGVRLLGAPATRPGRLVLVRDDETRTVVGLLVDGVQTLIGVAEDEVREPPPAAETDPELVAGVVDHESGVVTILRPGRVAAPPDSTRTEVEGT